MKDVLEEKLKRSSNVITDPSQIRLRGRFFCLSHYQVCLNAYLAIFGIGHARMTTVKNHCFSELVEKKQTTSDV